MHDRPEDRVGDSSSIGSPSIGRGSPFAQMEQPLSPLAGPFDPNGPRIPAYEGVGARPFSPQGFQQNFLGFMQTGY